MRRATRLSYLNGETTRAAEQSAVVSEMALKGQKLDWPTLTARKHFPLLGVRETTPHHR